MRKMDDKTRRRLKRKASIRKRVSGTAERPRLSVYKSNRHTYVQAVDDVTGRTLASASNLETDHRDIKNVATDLNRLGELIGARLKERSIEAVVFDRNGAKYHGKVKAVAEGARKAGIRF
jgi:large subunit ribosomal protein L18